MRGEGGRWRLRVGKGKGVWGNRELSLEDWCVIVWKGKKEEGAERYEGRKGVESESTPIFEEGERGCERGLRGGGRGKRKMSLESFPRNVRFQLHCVALAREGTAELGSVGAVAAHGGKGSRLAKEGRGARE